MPRRHREQSDEISLGWPSLRAKRSNLHHHSVNQTPNGNVNEHMPQSFAVYILTNQGHSVLYTGVTRDLKRRVFEHRQGLVEGFTRRYHAKKLVWYEVTDSAYSAITREKQIKAGSRAKKLAQIDTMNPGWRDLYDEI